MSVFHALVTPDLKSCGLRGFLLLCSASDELELRSTGATKSYVVAAMNYNTTEKNINQLFIITLTSWLTLRQNFRTVFKVKSL